MEAVRSALVILFGNDRVQDEVRLPVCIPKNAPDHPPINLLGRDPFFYEYDVHFRMGFAETKGKFTIARAKHRSDGRFGGVPRVGPAPRGES